MILTKETIKGHFGILISSENEISVVLSDTGFLLVNKKDMWWVSGAISSILQDCWCTLLDVSNRRLIPVEGFKFKVCVPEFLHKSFVETENKRKEKLVFLTYNFYEQDFGVFPSGLSNFRAKKKQRSSCRK